MVCLFSRINGIPACANKELLTDIPRGEWGFKGYIVSDAGNWQILFFVPALTDVLPHMYVAFE